MSRMTTWDKKLTVNRIPPPNRAYDREDIRKGKVRLAYNLEPEFKPISQLELGTALSTESIRRSLRILVEKGWVEMEKSQVKSRIDYRKQWSEASYRLANPVFKEKCIEELSKVLVYKKANELESYKIFSALLSDGDWQTTAELAKRAKMKPEVVFARLQVLHGKGMLNKESKIEKTKIEMGKGREIYANRKTTYWQLKEIGE